MGAKEDGLTVVSALVSRFGDDIAYFKGSTYNETQVRTDFIDKFFEALGWDIYDEAGHSARREVVLELTTRAAPVPSGLDGWDDDLTEEELAERMPKLGRPDYVFRVDAEPVFVAEAKKPSVNLQYKVPTFQAKSYGYSMELPIAVLTDFEELRIFDVRYRPRYDEPRAGIYNGLDLTYDQYIERWDDLWDVLSREAVGGGSLEAIAGKAPSGANPVDIEFLAELKQWRENVAQDIFDKNPAVSTWELAEATQRILDRVVFIRVMEDKGVLATPILRGFARRTDAYRALGPQIKALASVYNGQIFKPHFSDQLDVSDSVFQPLVASLYPPASPYRFDALGVNLLGKVYEQFLGDEIVIEDNEVAIRQKEVVRKAGGVYYTPPWIVRHIVESTVGALLSKCSKPGDVAKLRILDPACGSGAFLLGAFERLLAWHLEYYDNNPKKDTKKHFLTKDGERCLTADAKSEILRNNLFGVDIDHQAVEVTQMSLYLAMLEDETESTLASQRRLFESAVLPGLGDNIRFGNSLLESGDIDPVLFLGDDALQRRVNPFDWKDSSQGFGEVFERKIPGFDAVIGNPPYTRTQVLQQSKPEETEAYKKRYTTASEGSYDISMPFIERGAEVLRDGGLLGYIVSQTFWEVDSGKELRKLLTSSTKIVEIVDFTDALVFGDDVGAYTCILVLTKAKRAPSTKFQLTRVTEPTSSALRESLADNTQLIKRDSLSSDPWLLLFADERDRLSAYERSGSALGDIADAVFQGIPTGADFVFHVLDRGVDPTDPKRRIVAHRKSGVEASIEQSLLKPVLQGRSEIRRFGTATPTSFLLFPYVPEAEGFRILQPADLKKLPGAAGWLSQHKDDLQKRSGIDKDDPIYWKYSRPQNFDKFLSSKKLMVPYMTDALAAHVDENQAFFVNVTTGGYGVMLNESAPDEEYVGAILESETATWIVRQHSRVFRGGYFAVRAANLKRIPIPSANRDDQQKLVSLWTQCKTASSKLAAETSDAGLVLKERQLEAAIQAFNQFAEDLYNSSK